MRRLPFWLDAAGVSVFAVSGAVVASRKQLASVGFGFEASVSGIGGCTVPDLLLGRDPVYRIAAPFNSA